ncbi:hypothetical protein MPSEU_000027700 [Mayamaea pseudoterrestris]|nr:hypothetical protein MPSEU_000027700 [Mayamaea pseudoterrestris]
MAAPAFPESPNAAAAPVPKHLNDRLHENDPTLTRIEVTNTILSEFTTWELNDFPTLLPKNKVISHVHLSGDDLEDTLTNEQIDALLTSIGQLPNLQELFVFRGECEQITGTRLAKLIQQAHKLTVVMLWGFADLSLEPELAAAMRMHPNLERVTLTLPRSQPYAGMDIFAMGWACMPKLKCLSIRCQLGQKEPIFSPEALTLLMSSTSITSMYLEGCALIDDHCDVMAEQLKLAPGSNKTLSLLDLKHNQLSDDALYSFASAIRTNTTLTSLDLSGVAITEGGVNALADAMHDNKTLLNLELEGVLSRYQDEFNVPEGHSNTEYMQALTFQLRLNRAGSDESRPLFVEALNLVSDHLGCLYHLIRKNPSYCNRRLNTLPMAPYAVPRIMITPADADDAAELSEPVKRMFQSYAMH